MSGRRRAVAVVLIGATVLPVIYGLITFVQVWWASNRDDARPVDAIVVLGAAQYDGRPSPVLEARLDRALELYEQGLADTIVTTGANQPGDRFTEGFVGLTWLLERGVPEDAVLVVVHGTNTYDSLTATRQVLADRGVGDEVLLVSDPYHHLRASEIAREVGLDAHFSPADTPSSGGRLIKESVGVAAGRLLGFRRVANLT